MIIDMDLQYPAQSSPASGHEAWSYDDAFARNRGLISTEEQDILRHSRIAIAGMGGVGGVHLMTLARLGVGAFNIADPDYFEVANFNRQYGAQVRHLGQEKVQVMAREVREVNPEVDLRCFSEPIDVHNVDQFLNGADLFVDGVDFFCIEARRLLFREARNRGLWGITAGPLGFSAAWLLFDPRGMSFDEYFDLRDDMDVYDKTAAMAVGLCPAATHIPYMDLRHVDLNSGRGPSVGLACQLCSGIVAAEAMKILCHRGKVQAAPHYFQFDAYRQQFKQGHLWWGNRNPLQRLKRSWIRRRFLKVKNAD